MNEYELWYYKKGYYKVHLCYQTAKTAGKAKYQAYLHSDCCETFFEYIQGLYVRKIGTAPPRLPTAEELEKQVNEFNKAVPVGAKVKVKMDDGSIKETITHHPATVLSGHSAVAWLKDISGCYLLERVTAI